IEKQKTTCGTASCQLAVDAACSWSALQGAEYYAIASVSAQYSSSYKCTAYDTSIFDKNDGDCIEGHETNQASTASYVLDVYDVKTCKEVRALSQRITSRAFGVEEQSKPEALAKLGAKVPAKAEGLPDQIMIGADGRVVGEATDNYYALFRGGDYRGYVRVRGAGTQAEQLRPMYFPMAPQPGDALVRRGRRKFVDLALDGAIASLTFDGSRHIAGGIGAHVRHYTLDGGLQYGFGADLLGSVATNTNVFLFTPELGWGVPIAPGFVASANVGVGFARGKQVIASMNDMLTNAYAAHVIATARVQTFLTTWFYVTVDAGYVYTGTFDDWNGTGIGAARPMSMRSPIARIYAGFDL
ncbi:MAG TPA: hypothetical protein VIV11_42340, partial [Kofleriaceae bacterium]